MAARPHLQWFLLGSRLCCSALMGLSKTWVPGNSSAADTQPEVIDRMENYPQAYAVIHYFTKQKISCKISDWWLLLKAGNQKTPPHQLWVLRGNFGWSWIMSPPTDRASIHWVIWDPSMLALLDSNIYIMGLLLMGIYNLSHPTQVKGHLRACAEYKIHCKWLRTTWNIDVQATEQHSTFPGYLCT